jgi:uncharacterized protein YjdB
MAKGKTTITAAIGAMSVSTPLAVNAVVLQSITVTPANPTVAVGGTQQFQAIGNYTDGSSKDVTSSATWSSSAKKVASIEAAGLAKGLAPGAATITAKMGSVSGSAVLQVQ